MGGFGGIWGWSDLAIAASPPIPTHSPTSLPNSQSTYPNNNDYNGRLPDGGPGKGNPAMTINILVQTVKKTHGYMLWETQKSSDTHSARGHKGVGYPLQNRTLILRYPSLPRQANTLRPLVNNPTPRVRRVGWSICHLSLSIYIYIYIYVGPGHINNNHGYPCNVRPPNKR